MTFKSTVGNMILCSWSICGGWGGLHSFHFLIKLSDVPALAKHATVHDALHLGTRVYTKQPKLSVLAKIIHTASSCYHFFSK